MCYFTRFGFVLDDVLGDGTVAVLTQGPTKFDETTAFFHYSEISRKFWGFCQKKF